MEKVSLLVSAGTVTKYQTGMSGDDNMHALEKLIVYYNHCKENDIYKSVIENMLKNLDKVKNANIYELADLCYASPTTISRLSRKMGYEGFADFKMSIVHCVRNYDGYNNFVPVSVRGSSEESIKGYFELMHRLLDHIENHIDMAQIRRINQVIHESKKICFYTCGNESVERHFQELLIISGKESAVSVLPQLQMENMKTLDETCTVIYMTPVVSESGDTAEVIEGIRQKGAKLVLVTDSKNHPCQKYADEFVWFDGAMCVVDDHGFSMLLTVMLMDYRETYMR